jgi:probable rRNA maturation factor
MQLHIHNTTKSRLPGKMIRHLFELVVKGEAKGSWEATINIVVIGDRAMQSLNKKHRKLDKPTDVLSFNIDRPIDKTFVFGEIYISCDTARRQAKAYDGNLIDEYTRLACHGLLHLFGYDHKKPADAKIMQSKEARYLDQLERG